jgi:hypothetical protein
LLRTVIESPSFGHRIQRLELHIRESPQIGCYQCPHQDIDAQKFLDIARITESNSPDGFALLDVWREELL